MRFSHFSALSLIFSITHPTFDWILVKERQLVPDDSTYFQTTLYTTAWGGFGEPRPKVTAYRRSLSAMLNPLLSAGFLLNHILEPLPTEEYKTLDPEGYAERMELPGFIVIRAQK